VQSLSLKNNNSLSVQNNNFNAIQQSLNENHFTMADRDLLCEKRNSIPDKKAEGKQGLQPAKYGW
jgi:hypothetical protein